MFLALLTSLFLPDMKKMTLYRSLRRESTSKDVYNTNRNSTSVSASESEYEQTVDQVVVMTSDEVDTATLQR